MIKALRGWFANDISIDLGCANTLIYVCGQGIVLNEPSTVAIRYTEDNSAYDVVAVGDEAKKMLGRTPENMETVRPFYNGRIVDWPLAEKMLKHFLNKMINAAWIKPRSRIVMCVPSDTSAEERRTIKDTVKSVTRVKEVYLVEAPIAAAMGAGLPIHEATASMLIDIGGSTTNIAVISLNGIVLSTSLKVGSDHFHYSIIDYFKRNYQCLVGEATAEQIKIEMGTAFPLEEVAELPVRGRHMGHGIPVSFVVNSNEIIEALEPVLSLIMHGIHSVLEKTPPELAADISRVGMDLVGGGSLLRNIDLYIKEELGISAKVAKDPMTCVARGAAMILEKSLQKTKKVPVVTQEQVESA